MSAPSLDTLPTELLHRILDHVDAETVFLSFPNVCQYFRAVFNSYNQYKLDFCAITKPSFHRLCHFIEFENVISLTLSNDHRTSGQIESFISLFDIYSFTRLRSVTLIQINNEDLTILLRHISKCPLISLSIEKGRYDRDTTRVETLPLLLHCPIRRLTLTQWDPFKSIFDTLVHFPHLQVLLLDGLIISNKDQIPADLLPILSTLKSLAIHFHSSNVETIKSVLSRTPSLTHLRLTGRPAGLELTWDGYWWAEFIEKYLPLLQSFEFFVSKHTNYAVSENDIESMIIPFRTSFWLDKRWYVTCEHRKDTGELDLYTTPICKSTISYRPAANKISCSNSMTEIPYIMDNVYSLIIDSFPAIPHVPGATSLSIHPLFTRASKLTLSITKTFSDDSIDYLSSLVDLSHVDTVALNLDLCEQSLCTIRTVVSHLFDRTCNVQTIHLYSTRPEKLGEYLKIIHSTIPKAVRNLIIDIANRKEVQWILDQFERFSSITFRTKIIYPSFFDHIVDRVREKRQDFTYIEHMWYSSFWFGRQTLNS